MVTFASFPLLVAASIQTDFTEHWSDFLLTGSFFFPLMGEPPRNYQVVSACPEEKKGYLEASSPSGTLLTTRKTARTRPKVIKPL